MSVYSGKRVHGYKWDEFPVDDYVVERVESLAEEEKQPTMHKGMPSFEWSPGIDVTNAVEEEEEELLLTQDRVEDNTGEPILEIEPVADQEIFWKRMIKK